MREQKAIGPMCPRRMGLVRCQALLGPCTTDLCVGVVEIYSFFRKRASMMEVASERKVDHGRPIFFMTTK